MQLYTFNGREVSTGVAMEVMILSLNLEAKKNPKATMSDLSWNTLIDWQAGAGTATVTSATGEVETFEFSDKAPSSRNRHKNVLKLSAGDTVQLVKGDGVAFTVAIDSDSITTVPGLVPRPQVISDPRKTDTLQQAQVRQWLGSDDVGRSSKTIAHALYGVPESMTSSEYSTPQDPSDFRRCVKLMDAVPGTRERIGELASIKGWKNLAPVWGELEDLYNTEVANNTGSAPQLFARLQDINHPPRRAAKP